MVQSQTTVLASRLRGANGNFIAARPPLRFSWTTRGGFTRREVDELTSIALDAGCRLGPRIADEVYQRRSHGDNFERRDKITLIPCQHGTR